MGEEILEDILTVLGFSSRDEVTTLRNWGRRKGFVDLILVLLEAFSLLSWSSRLAQERSRLSTEGFWPITPDGQPLTTASVCQMALRYRQLRRHWRRRQLFEWDMPPKRRWYCALLAILVFYWMKNAGHGPLIVCQRLNLRARQQTLFSDDKKVRDSQILRRNILMASTISPEDSLKSPASWVSSNLGCCSWEYLNRLRLLGRRRWLAGGDPGAWSSAWPGPSSLEARGQCSQ